MAGGNYFGQPTFGEYFEPIIRFDATTGSGYQAASSSYSWLHTVGTGANQILVVSVSMLSAANSVTGVTFNGDALTKLRHDVSASTTVRTEIWYRVAPDVGSFTVAVTLAGVSVSGATASSYNNVDQSTPVDAQNGTTGVTGAGGGSATVDTTTVTNGAVLVDSVSTVDTTINATNLQTERGNITGVAGSGGQSDKWPNVVAGTAVTMQWDNIGALTSWTISTMALRPFRLAIDKALSGTLSFTGSATKSSNKILAGTLNFIGSTTKLTNYILAATLSFAGSFTKLTSRTVTGTLSFLGSMVKSLSRTLTGTLSFSGSFTKQINKIMSGTLSFTGAMSRLITKALSGTLSFVGTFLRLTSRGLTATLSFSGSIAKKAIRGLTASLSFVGNIVTTYIPAGGVLYTKAVSATLNFSGAIGRRTNRTLTGGLSFIAGMAIKPWQVLRSIIWKSDNNSSWKQDDPKNMKTDNNTIWYNEDSNDWKE